MNNTFTDDPLAPASAQFALARPGLAPPDDPARAVRLDDEAVRSVLRVSRTAAAYSGFQLLLRVADGGHWRRGSEAGDRRDPDDGVVDDHPQRR